MKESYNERVATYVGPESCVACREARDEALTGESAGWVLSRESHEPLRGADAVEVSGRPHPGARYARVCGTPRGQRPHARVDASCTGTGRSHDWPWHVSPWPARGTLRGQA